MRSEVAACLQMKRDPSTMECVPHGSTGSRRGRWCHASFEGKYHFSPVECLSHARFMMSCDESEEECWCDVRGNIWGVVHQQQSSSAATILGVRSLGHQPPRTFLRHAWPASSHQPLQWPLSTGRPSGTIPGDVTVLLVGLLIEVFKLLLSCPVTQGWFCTRKQPENLKLDCWPFAFACISANYTSLMKHLNANSCKSFDRNC